MYMYDIYFCALYISLRPEICCRYRHVYLYKCMYMHTYLYPHSVTFGNTSPLVIVVMPWPLWVKWLGLHTPWRSGAKLSDLSGLFQPDTHRCTFVKIGREPTNRAVWKWCTHLGYAEPAPGQNVGWFGSLFVDIHFGTWALCDVTLGCGFILQLMLMLPKCSFWIFGYVPVNSQIYFLPISCYLPAAISKAPKLTKQRHL